MTTQEMIQIITLAENLAPAAVTLIKQLMADLSGKTDDEILAEADSIFDSVKAKARAAQGLPPA